MSSRISARLLAVLAVLAVTFAARPPTRRRTFGYYPLEILDAVRRHIIETPGVLDQLSGCLTGHFAVEHCTFQLEPSTHEFHTHA